MDYKFVISKEICVKFFFFFFLIFFFFFLSTLNRSLEQTEALVCPVSVIVVAHKGWEIQRLGVFLLSPKKRLELTFLCDYLYHPIVIMLKEGSNSTTKSLFGELILYIGT